MVGRNINGGNTSGDLTPSLAPPLALPAEDHWLAEVLTAWAGLPDHIRQAVLALVRTAAGSRPG